MWSCSCEPKFELQYNKYISARMTGIYKSHVDSSLESSQILDFNIQEGLLKRLLQKQLLLHFNQQAAGLCVIYGKYFRMDKFNYHRMSHFYLHREQVPCFCSSPDGTKGSRRGTHFIKRCHNRVWDGRHLVGVLGA